MEPDKTYPLHSDDTSHAGPTSTPSDDQQRQQPMAPSNYDQSPRSASSLQPDATPWYLRPLTKATQSPLTSSQTRPYVPRQPLPPQERSPQQPSVEQDQQLATPSHPEPAEQPKTNTSPASPFRSTSSIPSSPQSSQSSQSLSSEDRFRMPVRPKAASYQQALSSSGPKPFSQFGAQSTNQPMTSRPSQSGRFRKLLGIALVVVLVGGIGAGVYSLWRHDDGGTGSSSGVVVANTEDELYKAIENHLSTSKIRQVFHQTVTADNTSTVKIEATSDFTNLRIPKSYIKYELRSGEGATVIEGAGELIVQDAGEYYGKLTKPVLFYQGADGAKPKEGQWYAVPLNDTTGETFLDPMATRSSINSPLGEFPIGNFSDGTRQELMQYIKKQNIYSIKSSEQIEIDGQKMTHYTLDLNAARLNDLNKKIYAAVRGKSEELPVDFVQSGTKKVELWVSNDSTKITKLKIDRESKAGGGTVKESTTVDIAYPSDVSAIKKPSGVMAGPWRSVSQ